MQPSPQAHTPPSAARHDSFVACAQIADRPVTVSFVGAEKTGFFYLDSAAKDGSKGSAVAKTSRQQSAEMAYRAFYKIGVSCQADLACVGLSDAAWREKTGESFATTGARVHAARLMHKREGIRTGGVGPEDSDVLALRIHAATAGVTSAMELESKLGLSPAAWEAAMGAAFDPKRAPRLAGFNANGMRQWTMPRCYC